MKDLVFYYFYAMRVLLAPFLLICFTTSGQIAYNGRHVPNPDYNGVKTYREYRPHGHCFVNKYDRDGSELMQWGTDGKNSWKTIYHYNANREVTDIISIQDGKDTTNWERFEYVKNDTGVINRITFYPLIGEKVEEKHSMVDNGYSEVILVYDSLNNLREQLIDVMVKDPNEETFISYTKRGNTLYNYRRIITRSQYDNERIVGKAIIDVDSMPRYLRSEDSIELDPAGNEVKYLRKTYSDTGLVTNSLTVAQYDSNNRFIGNHIYRRGILSAENITEYTEDAITERMYSYAIDTFGKAIDTSIQISVYSLDKRLLYSAWYQQGKLNIERKIHYNSRNLVKRMVEYHRGHPFISRFRYSFYRGKRPKLHTS